MSTSDTERGPVFDRQEATVRSVVHDLFFKLGLTTVFGNPGSTELPMFRDMPDGLRYILGLQESVVVGMADGFAQASGNAALVNLHSSAGLGHALGNIFTAYRNQTPLVITAGQQARSMLPLAPFLFAERATEFPAPFVKSSIEPARAEDVPQAIAQAYHLAMQQPRGPTFVSIPIDDWDRPCPPVTVSQVSRSVDVDSALIETAAKRLADAESPAIVAGAGVAWDDAQEALAALAERHSAPVWVAPMAARNVIAEDHRLFAGFLDAARESIVDDLEGHDLVLVLGAPVFIYHVEGAGPLIPEGAELIQIVDNPTIAARTQTGLAMIGHVGHAIDALLAGPDPASRRDPARRAAVPDPDPAILDEALLMSRLDALRPAGIAILEEAPGTRGAMHNHLPVRSGESFHTCASGGLGHSLPASVGVALAQPDRTVLALIGDGSAMYAIQALWTAAQVGADIRFLIVNNGGYAALDRFGEIFGVHVVGSKIPGIDFPALAESMGVPAESVSDANALDQALSNLFSGDGPKFLEVKISC